VEQQSDFDDLKKRLGVCLQFLEPRDQEMIERLQDAAASPVMVVRKVICVELPPKTSSFRLP
jgi:hypothetical protein